MEGLERAKAKEKILNYLLESGMSANNIFLSEELFNREIGKTETRILLEEMDKAEKYLINIKEENDYIIVRAYSYAAQFLKKGGFVDEYNKQVEAAQKLNENIIRESNVKELEEIELKQKIRNNRYALPLSIISILIALGSIFLPKLEKGNDGQLKAIQERMDYLEGTLVKENDSMRLVINKIKDTIK